MEYFYITFLILSFNAIQGSIYTKLKNNVFSLLLKSNEDSHDLREIKLSSMRSFHNKKQDDVKDARSAKYKAKILKSVRKQEEDSNIGRDMPSSKLTESFDTNIGKEYFVMDPVLNQLKRRSGSFRRKKKSEETSSSAKESSSTEMKLWMDEWDDKWMQKKFEALNSTRARGDVVNMVAARPWGTPCGDPNQHDTPWGTCTLAPECDPEFRIYRGDFFCGRTQYVCCAVILTNYDMYQGLDMSLDDSDFSTDSNEDVRAQASERKQRKAEKETLKRERAERKRHIIKMIAKIVLEIRKILNRSFRNASAYRKQRTKELMDFVDKLKAQYRKDRNAMMSVHEYEMVKIDKDMQNKLNQIVEVNEAFMNNNTFREIVINGTVNKEKLAMLLRSFPQLAKLLAITRHSIVRPNKTTETSQAPSGRRRMSYVRPMSDERRTSDVRPMSDERRTRDVRRMRKVRRISDAKRKLLSDMRRLMMIRETEEEPTILEYDLEYGQLYF